MSVFVCVCVSSVTYIIHVYIIFVPNWIQGGRHFSSPNDQYGRKKYAQPVKLNLRDIYNSQSERVCLLVRLLSHISRKPNINLL